MKLRLLLLALFTASLMAPLAHCYEYTYELMPNKGTSTTEILIMVRVDPLIDTNNIKLTVFWDKILIKTMHQLPSTQIGKTTDYKHSWDIFLTPPVNYNGVGDHKLEIWLETPAGDIHKLPYQYEITDGPLTTVKAWEQFIKENPELISQLQGSIGPKGETGPPGPRGAIGETGAKGAPGPTGEVGPIGLQGVRGIQGTPGESASPITLIAASSVSIIVSMAFTYYWTKKEEAG